MTLTDSAKTHLTRSDIQLDSLSKIWNNIRVVDSRMSPGGQNPKIQNRGNGDINGLNKFLPGRGGPHLLDSWAAYLRWIPMVKFMPQDSSASRHYTLHSA